MCDNFLITSSSKLEPLNYTYVCMLYISIFPKCLLKLYAKPLSHVGDDFSTLTYTKFNFHIKKMVFILTNTYC